MNINEAYEFVMSKLERLKNEGIEVTLNEPIKTSVLIEKYNPSYIFNLCKFIKLFETFII